MAFSLSPYVNFVTPLMPAFPGVPTLINGTPTGAIAALAFTGLASLGGAFQQTWGIFSTGGAPILEADSVFAVEFMQDFRISDYPQEQGAFESYNKVQVPFQAKVTFALNQDRESFLQGIFAQLYSLQLVTVVTPEISYPSANLIHCGYRRTARDGVTLILVEVWVEEVRISTTSAAGGGPATASGDTASQNGEDPSNDGSVQPQQTTTAPVDQTTGNLLPGLPNPPSQLPSNGLPTPNIGSAFYNANNIPQVPNEVASLNSPQQGVVASYGNSLSVQSATVYTPPPAATGGTPNAYMSFSAPQGFNGPGSE